MKRKNSQLKRLTKIAVETVAGENPRMKLKGLRLKGATPEFFAGIALGSGIMAIASLLITLLTRVPWPSAANWYSTTDWYLFTGSICLICLASLGLRFYMLYRTERKSKPKEKNS